MTEKLLKAVYNIFQSVYLQVIGLKVSESYSSLYGSKNWKNEVFWLRQY